MMKEEHIQVGDYQLFKQRLNNLGVNDSPLAQLSATSNAFGLKVIVNKLMPAKEAWLVSADGRLVQRFRL